MPPTLRPTGRELLKGTNQLIGNAELAARRNQAVPMSVTNATALYADRAVNAEIWDVEGRRYIDFAGGIAVLAVGHSHPKVIAAVGEQLLRFTHTAFQVMPYPSYVELAERLNLLAPFSGDAKTLLFTTGGEAVENAIKIARRATGRSGTIAFSGAFHGRTLMGMALTGKVAPYKTGFGTLPAEVYHVPFPSEKTGVTVDDTLRALAHLFAADIAPDRVASIIIEPVQGEGGFNVAPGELLRGLRSICDLHGIKLIVDEVQTGFARTGRMFAIEHSGVEPDLVVVAKSLGGGLPLSAVVGRAELMDQVKPGELGGTYGGAPLACAAALAVLDIIEEEALVARATEIGTILTARISAFGQRNDLLPISAPRGLGAMVAFDVLVERGAPAVDPVASRRVTAVAASLGLIVLNCGPYGEAVRILIPLTASDALIAEGLSLLEEALRLDCTAE
jgi:4-aminobutyrate aminotransferase/(S)-3-amino-2-methylpropionate transaminase